VSPNQIGHSADDKDDEENQTRLKQNALETRRYLHCAQCCYVMIDRKASVQLTCETESEPSGAKTAVALLHYALVSRKSQQMRKIALEAEAWCLIERPNSAVRWQIES